MSIKDDLLNSTIKKAKSLAKKPKIVLCEGWDERGLKAAEYIVKENIANMLLLGDESLIKQEAEKFNVDISEMAIINPKTSDLGDELAQALAKKREKKGLTVEQAKELIKDENYFGCVLALTGKVDAVVGSLIRSTAALMKPALQILRKDLVNEVSVLYDELNDRILFATDFSLNIDPTSEQLSNMAINAANVAKVFNFTPRVGFLSFSTYGSGGNGPRVQKVKDAIELAKQKAPEYEFDGEFQVDAAVNPAAAERKCPDSKLGGKINTLIFPNLTASNIFCHGIMQFSKMDFLFTIIAGLNNPVSILGRSTPFESVKNMIIVAAVQTAN